MCEQMRDGFVKTAVSPAAVKADELTAVEVDDHRILLARWEGKLYAFSSLCPHASASLEDGGIRRWKVSCVLHGYCFDIRTGRITWPEDEMYRLKRFEVREAGGVVWIKT